MDQRKEGGPKKGDQKDRREQGGQLEPLHKAPQFGTETRNEGRTKNRATVNSLSVATIMRT